MQRNTQQRRSIRQALEEAGRPLSPQEILDRAQEITPGLGIATVYRNIRMLLDEGWLRSVDLPSTPSRYELAGKSHHHHFHCTRCDRVYEVDDCPGSLETLAPTGFQVEAHEVVLYGACAECVQA